MTLSELKYIVAVARERHFGRAAQACFVSQPALSVAVKKLEDELEVKIFERSAGDVAITPLGQAIINQAQNVLDQAELIRQIAKSGKDPLEGPLRLGVIHTIGPYLLPQLVQHNIELTPQMPLMLQENFTGRLLEMLRAGELDCAILAEPYPDTSLASQPLYDEPFLAAVPGSHPLAQRTQLTTAELKDETMLLLGAGHCFRDQVLEICPESARVAGHASDGLQKTFEGSSLETIKHMVAAGMGITLVPCLAAPQAELLPVASVPATATTTAKSKRSAAALANHAAASSRIRYIPVVDASTGAAPTRRVTLAWRRSFTRDPAIEAVRQAINASHLPGVSRL